jgi:hypothetical protein
MAGEHGRSIHELADFLAAQRVASFARLIKMDSAPSTIAAESLASSR